MPRLLHRSYRGASHVLIASADKDLLALVSDRVEVHSTRTGNRIDPLPRFWTSWELTREQVPDYLTLVGDASRQHQGSEGNRT